MIILSIKTVTKLLIMILIGYIGARKDILTPERTDHVTKLLTEITLPCMLMSLGFTSYSSDKAATIGYVFLLSTIAQFFCMILAALVIRKKDNPEWALERGTSYTLNAGFVGGAIITSMLGSEALFYSAGVILSSNIFIWVIVLWTMSGDMSKEGLIHALTSKTMICLFIGLILFFVPFELPTPITSAIDTIGGTSGPLALVIAGTGLYGLDLKELLKKKNAYISFFIKLLICPLCLIPLFKLFPQEEYVMLATLICCGTSCPAIIPVFALRYGHDHKYASAILAVGLVLCMLSLPLTVAIFEAALF